MTGTKQLLGGVAVAWAVMASSGRGWSAELTGPPVGQLLQQKVLADGCPLQQVQDYCEARVPRMPQAASAPSWPREATRLRKDVLERIVYRGQAAQWRDARCRVEWLETVAGGPGYQIKKLRFEALPGMWIPALLYEPEHLSGRVPAVLNVNGHSPEGKVYVPKQIRCINQAKRGMLALNVEWLGMGQLRTPGFEHGKMNQLDLCGTSGLAPFYFSMKRSLDLLLSLEHTDPRRVAVTGLSGGGWQTIIISSLDPRVKLAVPVAGYSSFRTRVRHLKDLGDSEQTPNDLATLVDYTHLTAMMAPRPTLLIYNAKDDCCFESGYALPPLLQAARPLFRQLGAPDALRWHVNNDPGTHNYQRDNRQALYRMLGDFFFAGDPDYDPKEIPSDDEVKTAEQLQVDLPTENESFHTLALRLAADMPAGAGPPRENDAADKWRQAARIRLARIVRAKLYGVHATEQNRRHRAGATTSYWRLEMADPSTVAATVSEPQNPPGRDGHDTRGQSDVPAAIEFQAEGGRDRHGTGDQWTVPAVVIEPPKAHGTALLIADAGRAATAEDAARLLKSGIRVVAIDPFCVGESYPGNGPARVGSAMLFPLLVAAVGDRPIGLQASQVAAAARWAAERYSNQPVQLVTRGPLTSTIGLIAAVLEPKAIGPVQLRDGLGSFQQIIQQDWSARKWPELFCFGLLESFDIDQLIDLVAPRKVTVSSSRR